MIISGNWFPPNSASHQPATLNTDSSGVSVRNDTEQLWQGNADSINVSSRVGNIPRKLTLANGSVFSTGDNDAVDQWLKQNNHSAHKAGILHVLESRWRWVFASLLTTLLLVILSFGWGLPWASERIAKSLPVAVNESLASGTLATLDKVLFEPTKTSPAKQQALRRHLKENLLPDDKQGFTFNLHFRHMHGGNNEDGLANAFALPSGDIVITDRLMTLAENQDEIDAILLHEIGHVLHRHSMRQVIQSSTITVALILVTGDISAIEEWTVALPGFLLESSYSRDFESEADHYAFERMLANNKDPANFGSMLSRMTKDVSSDSTLNTDWLKYISSHPASEERIKQAESYSERYKHQPH
uniref:Uncharacterized protein n=1 Tax=uncultured Thiotrichaceae bacterium TaxID=298394 RepID=A0A6S6U4H0_9GAMM|nr:MAG: Unknown protein [uncultured Thiotrichaceae bacterium]